MAVGAWVGMAGRLSSCAASQGPVHATILLQLLACGNQLSCTTLPAWLPGRPVFICICRSGEARPMQLATEAWSSEPVRFSCPDPPKCNRRA